MMIPTNDIREKIYKMVSSIDPLDDIENKHLCFVRDWLISGCEIFRTEKPATPDTHLVSYFVIISPEMDRVLLVDHKKAKLWLPAGGHVDPGEDPKETVTREAKEELGIEAKFLCEDPIFLTVTKTTGNVVRHTDVSLWYLLECNPRVDLDFDSNEFYRIQWFPIDEIPFEKSDPHMKRFIQKMKKKSAILARENM